MTDKELDSYNPEPYWSKRQWGFLETNSEGKAIYLHSGYTWSGAKRRAKSLGIHESAIGIVITLRPE